MPKWEYKCIVVRRSITAVVDNGFRLGAEWDFVVTDEVLNAWLRWMGARECGTDLGYRWGNITPAYCHLRGRLLPGNWPSGLHQIPRAYGGGPHD
jgi:hypothetical protein